MNMIYKSRLKVRTYECDMYGHVNNATFLNYCEFARVEFLNAMGFDLQTLMKSGFLLLIVKIEIEYKKPAYAGDELEITVKWIERGRTSSVFLQEIYNVDGRLMISARVTWVVTDLKGKPLSIPLSIINGYEKAFDDEAPAPKKGIEHG